MTLNVPMNMEKYLKSKMIYKWERCESYHKKLLLNKSFFWASPSPSRTCCTGLSCKATYEIQAMLAVRFLEMFLWILLFQEKKKKSSREIAEQKYPVHLSFPYFIPLAHSDFGSEKSPMCCQLRLQQSIQKAKWLSNKERPYISLIMLGKHYCDLSVVANSVPFKLLRKRPILTSAKKSMTRGKCRTIITT